MFLSEWIQSDSPMPVQNKSGKLLHKQECIMADESAQIRLVLWEDDINKLVINKPYKLDKMKIRMYNDVKYLSVSSCTIIESIDDIGHVANPSSDSELIPDRGNRLFNGSIVAVVSTDTYTSCINCKGKVNTLTSIIGQCNRCKTKMKLSSCQETSTANILFKPIGTGFGDELLRLVIFGDQIDNITSSIVADSVED